jgi:two-component system LytT family response regulator
MSTFRVVVVDDEPLARETAVALLQRDEEVQTIGECGDGLDAQAVIARERPDIVFLDIEMPGQDGLQLADAIQRGGPVIVFATAFSQYAVDAFDLAATDYLLKPFTDERFMAALARAKQRVVERRLGAAAAAATASFAGEPPHYVEQLTIKQGSRTVVLASADMRWIEAEDYCVMIHSTGGNYLIRASLASLEQQLDPRSFVRVHRAAIVNLDHVRDTTDRDGLSLLLTDGTSVGVSRARRAQVESRIVNRESRIVNRES